jgi:hypothetical protein
MLKQVENESNSAISALKPFTIFLRVDEGGKRSEGASYHN